METLDLIGIEHLAYGAYLDIADIDIAGDSSFCQVVEKLDGADIVQRVDCLACLLRLLGHAAMATLIPKLIIAQLIAVNLNGLYGESLLAKFQRLRDIELHLALRVIHLAENLQTLLFRIDRHVVDMDLHVVGAEEGYGITDELV